MKTTPPEKLETGVGKSGTREQGVRHEKLRKVHRIAGKGRTPQMNQAPRPSSEVYWVSIYSSWSLFSVFVLIIVPILLAVDLHWNQPLCNIGQKQNLP